MSTLDRRTFLKGTLWGLVGWALKWEVEEVVEAAPEEETGWHRIALQSGDDARKINLYIDGYPVNDAPFMDQLSNPIVSWNIARPTGYGPITWGDSEPLKLDATVEGEDEGMNNRS